MEDASVETRRDHADGAGHRGRAVRATRAAQNALARAAQRDLISFDNPEYQDIHIKLAADEARRVLEGLPGEPALYEGLADEFVDAYFGACRTARVPA